MNLAKCSMEKGQEEGIRVIWLGLTSLDRAIDEPRKQDTGHVDSETGPIRYQYPRYKFVWGHN